MTSIPAPVSAVLPPAAPRHAPPPAPGSPLATLDPIKLLNKYKWLLAGAAVAGSALGLAAHFALAAFHPIFKSSAYFNCLAPMSRIGGNDTQIVSETEMLRFMQTQAKLMTSDAVLSSVIDDPALRRNAPKWSKQFEEHGGASFNTVRALDDLRDTVGAHVVSQTSLIELGASFTDKYDAKALVELVRTKYMNMLQDQGRLQRQEMTRGLTDQISRIDTDVSALTSKRENIIQREGVASLNEATDAARVELGQITDELVKSQQQLDLLRKSRDQMESQLSRTGGNMAYSDDLVSTVSRSPQVLDAQADKQRLENALQSMLNQQYGEEHRAVRDIRARIRAAEQNLDDLKARLLREQFDGQLDTIRKNIGQLEASTGAQVEKAAQLRQRLTDMARVQSQLLDIADNIRNLLELRAQSVADQQHLLSLSDNSQANRVILAQPERVPDMWSFPKIQIMLPAGFILGVGLVGGIVVLREVVDQRVKGPSDIALMSRMRLVGWIPDASEDPAGPGTPETAFRDRPKGVVAEALRHVRASVNKRMQHAEAKTLLVLAGMPGSGATSTICNLALAFAATDRKVLVIDANFRRPGIHRVFGAAEAPGLADILSARGVAIEPSSMIQKTGVNGLDILPAGSKELRIFERLATEPMSELLAWARAGYDIVLIDVAPAIVGGDWIALAQRADATMLVVRAYAEKRGLVNRVRNELAEAKSEFIGALVNSVRSSVGGYMKGNMRAAKEYVEET